MTTDKVSAYISVLLALSLSLSLGSNAEAKNSKRDKTAKSDITENASDADKIKIAKKDKDDAKGKDDKKDKSDKKDKKDAKADDSKDDKDSKDKKDVKADAKGDKKDAKVDDKNVKADADTEKKKGGGLFHLGGGNKKEGEKPAAKAPAKADAKPAATAKPVEEEDPNKPKYKFDPALISVLKDINKTLKESEAVTKLEDPVQKLVAKLAGEALDKALAAPDLHANRIVEAKDKERMEKGLAAESWESGPIDVAPDLKASVVALWAKKIDGLLTIEIVGDYDGKPEGSSDRLGEFITVITARSTVDKGFDIQSQQDVNFWIGKVADLKIDCTKGSPESNLKSYLKLKVPITQRKREFLLALKDYENKLAKAEEDKKKQAEISVALAAQQKEVTEALAKSVAEALAKSVNNKSNSTEAVTASANTSSKGASNSEAASKEAGGSAAEKKSEGTSDVKAAGTQQASEAPIQKQSTESATQTVATNATPATPPPPPPPPPAAPNPSPAAAQNTNTNKGSSVATLIPETSRNNRSSWDSPSAPAAIRSASQGSTLVYPNRVVAGQYITVAVMSSQNTPEQFVGLSFNGAQLSTGDNGKVVYQVPDDAPPGYSLHVSVSSRPDEAPNAIEVLQPLASPSAAQIPNLESVSPVCGSGSFVTISGHSFDGIAERNRVIVDGAYDANVVVASPVQLKALLPNNIPAGQHTLCVSTAGLRSNPGNFDLVTVDLTPGGPDTPKNDLKKLMVKVVGTQNRVRVKLVNQTRDVIKMTKGDELVVVTSGGAQNQVVVPVQRLRWGNYKINAEILI